MGLRSPCNVIQWMVSSWIYVYLYHYLINPIWLNPKHIKTLIIRKFNKDTWYVFVSSNSTSRASHSPVSTYSVHQKPLIILREYYFTVLHKHADSIKRNIKVLTWSSRTYSACCGISPYFFCTQLIQNLWYPVIHFGSVITSFLMWLRTPEGKTKSYRSFLTLTTDRGYVMTSLGKSADEKREPSSALWTSWSSALWHVLRAWSRGGVGRGS